MVQSKNDDWMKRHGWVRNEDGDWVYRQRVEHLIMCADGSGQMALRAQHAMHNMPCTCVCAHTRANNMSPFYPRVYSTHVCGINTGVEGVFFLCL